MIYIITNTKMKLRNLLIFIHIHKMQSFTGIPSDDIISFLRANNISSSSDVHQNYLIAWNSLRSNIYQSVPSSISDWIIALNLATSNIHLPPITLLDILSMSDID